MQRIIDFGLDVQGYVDLVKVVGVGALVLPEWAWRCPFCKDRHKLSRHGSYWRYVITRRDIHQTRIRRLLCEVHGKTVSFLPSFLAPGKQHCLGVMGRFFEERMKEKSLEEAIEAATQNRPSKKKGQYWERSLEAKSSVTQTYLAGLRRRERKGTTMLQRIMTGFKTMAEALMAHNLRMHRLFQKTII